MRVETLTLISGIAVFLGTKQDTQDYKVLSEPATFCVSTIRPGELILMVVVAEFFQFAREILAWGQQGEGKKTEIKQMELWLITLRQIHRTKIHRINLQEKYFLPSHV